MSWLSKKLEKSKANQTGFFSWDDAWDNAWEEVGSWKLPAQGELSYAGATFGWGSGPKEEEILKYGFMALGVFVVYKLASK